MRLRAAFVLASLVSLGLAASPSHALGQEIGATSDPGPPVPLAFTAEKLVTDDGRQGAEVHLGDLDGDGDLDLLLRDHPKRVARIDQPPTDEPRARAFENDGAGRFTPMALLPFTDGAWHPYGFDLADMDGDGDADVLTWGYGDSWEIRLYRNDRQEGLSRVDLPPDVARLKMDVPSGWIPRSEPPAFLGDGGPDQELVLYEVVGGVPRRTDAWHRLEGVSLGLLMPTHDTDWFDYDDDGDLDVAASPWLFGGRGVHVLAQESPGVLSDVTNRLAPDALPFFEGGDCRWADFDGDGLTDLVVANYGPPPGVADGFLRNLGDGRLEPVVGVLGDDPPCMQSTECVVADFDLDGDLDVFFLGMHSAYVAENVGGFRFQAVRPWAAGDGWWPQGSCMSAGDVDGDGDVDLVIGSHPRLLRNQVRPHGGAGPGDR